MARHSGESRNPGGTDVSGSRIKSGMTIEVLIEEPAWSKKRLSLQKLSEQILTDAWKQLKGKGKSKALPSVSLVFTNDASIKKLNKKFRGKNKPTNVLSFQTWPDIASLPSGQVPVGDIVLAYETIAREALEAGIPFKNHLTHLLIHGFLHLFGYDHGDDAEADIMEGLEIKILKKMSIKNPYASL